MRVMPITTTQRRVQKQNNRNNPSFKATFSEASKACNDLGIKAPSLLDELFNITRDMHFYNPYDFMLEGDVAPLTKRHCGQIVWLIKGSVEMLQDHPGRTKLAQILKQANAPKPDRITLE